jgi:hypothetical protein
MKGPDSKISTDQDPMTSYSGFVCAGHSAIASSINLESNKCVDKSSSSAVSGGDTYVLVAGYKYYTRESKDDSERNSAFHRLSDIQGPRYAEHITLQWRTSTSTTLHGIGGILLVVISK